MRSRWFTTKAVLFLLSIAACSASATPLPQNTLLPEPATPLRFGQILALADFDADGLVDKATLASWGAHRRVEVMLSRSGKPLVLHFDNGSADRGSLVSQDVDNDGAADLIWTDLLHAEGVVIWMGDGDGRFSRVPASAYANGYTLPDTSFNSPDQTIRETSISAVNHRSSDEVRLSKPDDFPASALPQQRHHRVLLLSPVSDEPTDRGPPLSLF
jgi:hypothetical protein